MTQTADLAIVGGGPSALRALAELDILLAARQEAGAQEGGDQEVRGEESAGRATLAGTPPRLPRIVVMELAEPGAGAVWDTQQPEHLILNASSSIVDLSCPQVPLSYDQWAGSSQDSFPPRASVGRYLAWAFARLQASPRWELSVRRAWVDAVSPHAVGYSLRLLPAREPADALDAGHAQPREEVHAREVLLCTGHAPRTVPDHLALSGRHSGLQPHPNPAPGVPAAGSLCAIRGAALTAFDVIADLTLGRGGGFAAAPDGRLNYIPSGAEPAHLQMWSRSGLMMLPKPSGRTPGLAAAVQALTRSLEPGSVPDDAWWQQIRDAAIAAACTAGIELAPAALDAVWAETHHVASGQQTDPAHHHAPADITPACLERWRADLARAQGVVDADPRWWWGRAWAAGYSDVVRSLDRAQRDRESWSRFRARAALLEKWAFGPPARTIERLVALSESGLLTVHHGAPPPSGGESNTHTVDAITPGPGVLRSPALWGPPAAETGQDPAAPAAAMPDPAMPDAAWSALWAGLLADGLATVRPGERGVLTSREGQCAGPNGAPTPGLYALGRPTEDPTVGHDSLQRRLRPEFSLWAAGWSQRFRGRLFSPLLSPPLLRPTKSKDS